MARQRATVSQDIAAALYAEFGSERAAARAAGVPRSTFHDVLIGRFEGRTSTGTAEAIGRTAQAVGESVVNALTGLIRSLGGGDARAGARQLAPQSRRQPGVARQRAEQYRDQMAGVGLGPDGRPLPPPDAPVPPAERPERDRLGRRITDRQWEQYQDLQAAFEAGTLSSEQYERFAAMQLGSGSGGSGVDIADL